VLPQTTPDKVISDDLYGWNHTWTARLYEQFNEHHGRYVEANAALVSHAFIEPDQRLLDFAAGSGRTAEAALPYLDHRGHILCVEPAAAMLAMGRKRLADPRISWASELPATMSFDRVLCGAALWQVGSLENSLEELAGLISPGGALCFNIPALYLGQPDQPGGGEDPWLLALLAVLQGETAATVEAEASKAILDDAQVESLLEAAGLRPESWSFRVQLTQAAYRDWLKIPVLTNRLLPGLRPQERVRRIDEAYRQVPKDSWRWERWLGWTAWKGSA
jgi:SAM-dependent methyltransferase